MPQFVRSGVGLYLGCAVKLFIACYTMKLFCQFLLFIWLYLQGIVIKLPYIHYHLYSYLTGNEFVSGQPTLRPESIYACPNETVTFTCHDSHVVAIQWQLDMYIGAQITFSSSQPVGSQEMVYMDMISANLSEVTSMNGSLANITTTLTIITNGLLNKTNISCLTANDDNEITKSSSIIYFAGLLAILLVINSCKKSKFFQIHLIGKIVHLHSKRRKHISQQY